MQLSSPQRETSQSLNQFLQPAPRPGLGGLWSLLIQCLTELLTVLGLMTMFTTTACHRDSGDERTDEESGLKLPLGGRARDKCAVATGPRSCRSQPKSTIGGSRPCRVHLCVTGQWQQCWKMPTVRACEGFVWCSEKRHRRVRNWKRCCPLRGPCRPSLTNSPGAWAAPLWNTRSARCQELTVTLVGAFVASPPPGRASWTQSCSGSVLGCCPGTVTSALGVIGQGCLVGTAAPGSPCFRSVWIPFLWFILCLRFCIH